MMSLSGISLRMKHVFKMGYVPAIIAGLLVQMFFVCKVWAIDIEEFSTPSGIRVYLVEDYTSPIITMSFSFLGGSSQDPVGKEGATNMLAAMLKEGAGDMKGSEFNDQIEELGVNIRFSTEYDYFGGNIQTLKQNAEKAFSLLGLALSKPRFDVRAMERMRQTLLANLKRDTTWPEAISHNSMREALFKNHPYGQPRKGTIESVRNLDRDDLRKIHGKILKREGLIVSVVGAVDREKLGPLVDTAFSTLPGTSALKSIRDAEIHFGKKVKKQLDIPQSLISFALPGVKSSHPDFWPAYLASHILGGGSFSSRLFREVRDKRGLTYGIYSHPVRHRHASFIVIDSSTNSRKLQVAIDVIQSELQEMADHGPSGKELEAAKKYLVGAYAINNLDTSIGIADTLVDIQRENLGIDYIDRRADIINSVTLKDVKRVARELFGQKPTMVVVGPEDI